MIRYYINYTSQFSYCSNQSLLGRAQPVIPPNLYVNEHNSLGSSSKPEHFFAVARGRRSCESSASLGVMVRFKIDIRVYVKPFCSAAKP